MKHCVKLLAAAFLAMGVSSAYADSGTDRYMAGAAAGADARKSDGDRPAMSAARSLFSPMCLPGQPNCGGKPAPACKTGWCQTVSDCVNDGYNPLCVCLTRDITDPNAGGDCLGGN